MIVVFTNTVSLIQRPAGKLLRFIKHGLRNRCKIISILILNSCDKYHYHNIIIISRITHFIIFIALIITRIIIIMIIIIVIVLLILSLLLSLSWPSLLISLIIIYFHYHYYHYLYNHDHYYCHYHNYILLLLLSVSSLLPLP